MIIQNNLYKKQVNNKIFEFEIGTQNKIIRENLGIKNEHELIYKIKRLRIIDNEPFALETVYIPEKMCTGLKELLKEDDSLYRVFREEYNHKIEKAIQTIEAIIKMVNSLGGTVVRVCALIELIDLDARKLLKDIDIKSCIIYEGE